MAILIFKIGERVEIQKLKQPMAGLNWVKRRISTDTGLNNQPMRIT